MFLGMCAMVGRGEDQPFHDTVRFTSCSWECHERCTAVLIGSLMFLSIYMPHGGYDAENCITEFERVNMIEEGKALEVKDFLIGRDRWTLVGPSWNSKD